MNNIEAHLYFEFQQPFNLLNYFFAIFIEKTVSQEFVFINLEGKVVWTVIKLLA